MRKRRPFSFDLLSMLGGSLIGVGVHYLFAIGPAVAAPWLLAGAALVTVSVFLTYRWRRKGGRSR